MWAHTYFKLDCLSIVFLHHIWCRLLTEACLSSVLCSEFGVRLINCMHVRLVFLCLTSFWLAAGVLSSAEAVVKWLEVHPYLHAGQDNTSIAQQQPVLDAQDQLEHLSPLIQSELATQQLL